MSKHYKESWSDTRTLYDWSVYRQQVGGASVCSAPVAISSSTDVLECWGDKRVASSAYFMRKFKISSGLRSWANIIKSVGPIPEPCMIDQFISSMEERWKPRLVAWLRSVRNDMIHWIIKTGVSRQNSLWSSITWSTVSRALLKSISTHLTYSLDSCKVCIW